MLTFVALFCFCCLHTRIHYTLSAEFCCIAIKDFFIFPCKGHAHLVILVGYCGEITDYKQRFLWFLCLTQESDHILLVFHQLNPLKSVILIIHLIKSRRTLIKGIQRLNAFGKSLRHISPRCHHFTARMHHHIGISLSHLCQLLLLISRKFRHKLIQASHISVSKSQNIMLRICI